MADKVPGAASKPKASPSKKHSHPLDPLDPDEIVAASRAVQLHAAEKLSVKALRFIVCNLLPPPKKKVLAYLGIPLVTGQEPDAHPGELPRKAEVDFIDLLTGCAYNSVLTLGERGWVVESVEKLPDGSQPQLSPEELLDCESIIKADPEIQRLAKEVGIEPHQIFADGWAIGYDERFPLTTRVQQAFCFARYSEHENLYAHPLDFIPIVDTAIGKVIHIDFPAHYAYIDKGEKEHRLSATTTAPHPLNVAALDHSNRERIPPPTERFDFLPDLIIESDKNFQLREDIKPLHVIQPEGVSFKMNGHELEWQKWKMHISFSHREGIALSTITYNDNGVVRPIFYRLSLAEMVVPYAAPEHPHARKFAFDIGEYGLGTMANELALGCDCLGQIHYLPGAYVSNSGQAVVVKNVICIHEEDAGLLWKHTDYRTGGRSKAARARRLVVSMVCTLANYEYVWNYHFYQDGTIDSEIKLTGVLQTYVAREDEPNPYGTTIAPKINAQYHQHIFSLRVDPMIDGLTNSVLETDVVPSPAPVGSPENFAGNAFTTKQEIIGSEGPRDYDWVVDRRWRIVNTNSKHYASGEYVGYGIHLKGGSISLLAKEGSWVAQRAKFATKPLWVVKDKEGEKGTERMWPSGKYVPQSRGEANDSIGKWVEGKAGIENEDILLFMTIGVTHIPRPEDFPVMPAETLKVSFRPQSFFKINPSMDVPEAKDTKSVLVLSKDNCFSCD